MEILDASKRMFQSRGFIQTTMNEIATDSDLSRRTLYLYFHNKEEILLTLAIQTLEQLLSETEKNERQETTGIKRLISLASTYRNLYLADAGNFQFIPNFTNCVRSLGGSHPIVKKCENLTNELTGKVTQYLEDGMKDLSIRHIENSKKTAAILITMIHSFIQSVDTDNDLLCIALHISPNDFLDESFSFIQHYLAATN
nr:TetR/AcrR family transcriptional regulator [uncultured Sphaerochaeta sp.]